MSELGAVFRILGLKSIVDVVTFIFVTPITLKDPLLLFA